MAQHRLLTEAFGAGDRRVREFFSIVHDVMLQQEAEAQASFSSLSGCDCIHTPDDHDGDTFACASVNPIFGPCPCAATSAVIRSEQRRVWEQEKLNAVSV
jgi:hypothetical protein